MPYIFGWYKGEQFTPELLWQWPTKAAEFGIWTLTRRIEDDASASPYQGEARSIASPFENTQDRLRSFDSSSFRSG